MLIRNEEKQNVGFYMTKDIKYAYKERLEENIQFMIIDRIR